MSTLIVDELWSGVIFSQTITMTKETDIAYVRPWIYKHGTIVDGELTLRIKKGATLLKTVSIDYTEINAITADDFFHGYIRFETFPMTLNITDTAIGEDYILEFEMTNHSTDASNFVGIVRGYDDPIYTVVPSGANSMLQPCGLELYNFKENL